METVSVYAPADALGLHVRTTTEAHALAASADPVAAYLDIPGLIAAAKATGCDCVHPGYGFLSESAAFARACGEAGLVFIGPDAETLALFGDKTKARALARSASHRSRQRRLATAAGRDGVHRLPRDAEGRLRRRRAWHACRGGE